MPIMNSEYSVKSLEIPVRELESRYQIIGPLGSGSFGTVSLAKARQGTMEALLVDDTSRAGTMMQSVGDRPSNPTVAIKSTNKRVVKLSDCSRLKELNFIWAIKAHPALVQIFEVFVDSKSFKVQIVMETMDQNLYQLMKARKTTLFSPRTLKSVLSQLLSAIRHIHRCSYFHRDIKPENILVMQTVNFYGSKENIPPNRKNDSYIVKLADYGLARHVQNTKPYTAYVSTRWYRSPEILLRDRQYSYPVDVWAFGCVVVEAATFSPLFPGSNEIDQIFRILAKLGSPIPPSFYKGTPVMTESSIDSDDVVNEPFGGYWPKAYLLAESCGFNFPLAEGDCFENILSRSDLGSEFWKLKQIVRYCLTWDPATRATVEDICAENYFDDSVIREDDRLKASTTNPAPDCNLPLRGRPEPFAGLSTKSHNVPDLPPLEDYVSEKQTVSKTEQFDSIARASRNLANDENYDPRFSKKLRKLPRIPSKYFQKQQAATEASDTGSIYDHATPELVEDILYSSDNPSNYENAETFDERRIIDKLLYDSLDATWNENEFQKLVGSDSLLDCEYNDNSCNLSQNPEVTNGYIDDQSKNVYTWMSSSRPLDARLYNESLWNHHDYKHSPT
ncbi:unnamed protein product [Kuraishia capsulata CBS 1993]|uniref:Protein kinase domain-containing protein n=1 Tax=Kuraishia capsulata CBS 1993 TaxID=1382522 RepID=W6MM65_9ASCO|nr:uncharacterized protein KUCA_T00003590001 [Kuraishia capsulata CBS 1993]CDK27611.1 unnamed protein product [Kuraishia capsulata CBS 1993]